MPLSGQKNCKNVNNPIESEIKLINKSQNSVKPPSIPLRDKSPKKVTRTINAEKKKIVNNLRIKDPFITETVTLESEETSFKKVLEDTAVNTIITGSLQKDNQNVTVVQTRDNLCKCKCGKRKDLCVKEIQTILGRNNLTREISCTQCIETSSCGTQIISNSLLIKQNLNDTSSTLNIGVKRWALCQYPTRGPDF